MSRYNHLSHQAVRHITISRQVIHHVDGVPQNEWGSTRPNQLGTHYQ